MKVLRRLTPLETFQYYLSQLMNKKERFEVFDPDLNHHISKLYYSYVLSKVDKELEKGQ